MTTADEWAVLRQLAAQRSGGKCEACGRRFEAHDDGRPYSTNIDLHHRRRKAQGGRDVLSHLVIASHYCHVLDPGSIHQSPEWARSRGLIVPAHADPADTPLILPSGREVMLRDDYQFYIETGRWLTTHNAL